MRSFASTREARDSYFLIGVVLLTVAPHLPRLPLWAGAAALALLGWRAWLAAMARPLPPRWLLLTLLIVAVVATKISYGIVVGRTPGLTLICVLLVMKLLEMHARRDAFVVFFLGFFLVLSQYFYSQSLWVALWTVAAVWGLLTSLVLAQMPLGQPQLAAAGREAARSTLLGLPIMVLLFLLFPRIAPLWGLPGQTAGTGLNDTLRFGEIAELASDESIAMRLRPLAGGSLPAPALIYVRGPVLSSFDGQQWRAEPIVGPSRDTLELQGPVLRYEAMLEPQRLAILPLLEMAPGQPGETWSPRPGLELRRAIDLSWVSRRTVGERLRFEQVAVLDPAAVRIGPLEDHAGLRRLREQPAGLNPRLQAWARDQRRDLPDDGSGAPQLSQRLLAHIREQPFRYTLTPGVYGEDSPHAVDEFWFDRRAGFCEHYATAYVLAMRAAGVPARIVTGFQGSDATAVEGWTAIRNSNAHAWAEYWTPGLGWQRVDPTAAVAPERVERGNLLLANPGVLRGAVDALDPALWRRLREMAELVDLRWQQWVLGYERQQQFQLLEKLGFDAPDWNTLGHVAAGVMAALALLAWCWQRLQGRPRNPWQRRLERVHQLLQRSGWPLPRHAAPLRWAELLRNANAPQPTVQALLALEQWRYGPQAMSTPGWRARWQEARHWSQWWRGLQSSLRR